MWLRRRVRFIAGLAAAFAGAASIVGVGAVPAAAHASLVDTSPRNGAELDDPPTEIRLRFTERVSAAPDSLQLRDGTGAGVATGPASSAPDDPTVVVLTVPPDLADGGYVVSFRVVSADSHPVAGAFTFGVGAPAASLDGAGLTTTDPVVSAFFMLARLAGYAALALLCGGLVIFVFCWPGGWRNPRGRRVVRAGWLGSLAAALAVLVLEGPYGAGRSPAGIADVALLGRTLGTDYGTFVVVRLALVAVAGAVLLGGPSLRPGASGRGVRGACGRVHTRRRRARSRTPGRAWAIRSSSV
jgi:copper transport protein